MKRALLIPVVVLVALVGQAGAASLFSPLGLGVWMRTGTAYSAGIAGADLAITDSLYFPLDNPAGWTSHGTTRFSTSLIASKSRAESVSGDDVADELWFPSAAVTLPIYKTLGLGLVYQSLTDHEYLVRGQDVYVPEQQVDTLDSYDILTRVQGTGGLSLGGLRVAMNVTRTLQAGAGFDYYFGELETLTTKDYAQGSFIRSGQFQRRELSGFGGRLGLTWRPNSRSSVAATAVLPTSLTVSRSRTIQGGDSLGLPDVDYDLPLELNLGAVHRINRVRLLASGRTQLWDGYDSPINPNQQYVNARDVAVAVELLPLNEPLVPWYDIWTFRGGFRLGQAYVQSGGNPVMSWAATLGVGIPVARGSGMLDAALWFESRGNVDDNLGREHIYGLQFGITASERWFLRRD